MLDRRQLLSGAAVLSVAGASILATAQERQDAVVLPRAAFDPKITSGLQTIVLAGGCFWGVQGVYQHVKGVRKAISGYSGGDKATAQYQRVGRGDTGHAESVQVTFDPSEISYGEILR